MNELSNKNIVDEFISKSN